MREKEGGGDQRLVDIPFKSKSDDSLNECNDRKRPRPQRVRDVHLATGRLWRRSYIAFSCSKSLDVSPERWVKGSTKE